MKVNTTEKCKECGAVLQIEIGTDHYECANGHSFDGLPTISEPPAAETAPAVAAPEVAAAPESQVTPEDSRAEFQQILENAAALAPLVEAEAMIAAGTDEAPAFIAQPEPEPEPGEGGVLEEGTIQETSGGDILMVIRIPDPHAANLKNRAAECSQDFYSHFKDRLLFGLESGWYQ